MGSREAATVIEIPASVRIALEAYGPDEMARIVEYGARQIKARTEGLRLWKLAADDRYQFMVDEARKVRATYPNMGEFEIVVEVRQRMRDKGRKYSFGNGRILSEKTIHQYLRKAGAFSS